MFAGLYTLMNKMRKQPVFSWWIDIWLTFCIEPALLKALKIEFKKKKKMDQLPFSASVEFAFHKEGPNHQ